MAKHIVDGALVASSPSSIEAWDDSTPFGCSRRWWFRVVQGLPEPSTGNQQLGTNLHGRIEHYLEPQRKQPEDKESLRLFLAAKPVVDEIKAEGIEAVEIPMRLDVDGVQINGRIDVVTKTGILDWKTSSDLKRYGKTPGELRKSTQMLLYAKWLDENVKVRRNEYTLEHVYVQTKKQALVERVSAKIDRATLDAGMSRIRLLLAEMKSAAKEVDVSKLKADRTKCFNCPFRNNCPTDTQNTMANLLNRLAGKAPEAPSVLPPDAPKSDPALAADPVPGFAPAVPSDFADIVTDPGAGSAQIKVETAIEAMKTFVEATPTAPEPVKRGRGRPPKVRIVDVVDEAPVAVRTLPELPGADSGPVYAAITPTLDVQTITISHGATIPTAQFANNRIDVSMTAKVSGNVDEATKLLSEKVRQALMAEAEKLALKVAK